MIAIIISNDQKTLLFAAEELRRLLNKVGLMSKTYSYSALDEVKETKHIFLILQDEYVLKSDKKLHLEKDGFALIQDKEDVWIIGKEERSILYGVYHFAELQLGYEWVRWEEIEPTKMNALPLMKDVNQIHNPLFTRRGNIIETINDAKFIHGLIDWGVKNRLNEFFFTFFLWDMVKEQVREHLYDRNVNVTLGGHSLQFLLEKAGYVPSGDQRFFSGNINLQNQVIEEIIRFCKEDSIITRISLWPEDIGIEEKDFATFLSSYITFTEKLKQAISKENLPVEVEHIVYNAGLSWNMLERHRAEASNQVDVLYAYWGRDYSKSIKHPPRAYDALMDWSEQTRLNAKEMTVLEYYSDHFMLSELFPPLCNRLQEDHVLYEQAGIDGLLNLIVPLHIKPEDREMLENYPWEWIQQLNNYFYAGLSWGKDYRLLKEQFLLTIDNQPEEYWLILEELETILVKHTRWNSELFPARVVDSEKVSDTKETRAILCFLEELIVYLDKHSLLKEKTMPAKDKMYDLTTEELIHQYLHYLKKTAVKRKKEWEQLEKTLEWNG